jgi:hypothetical protein
MTKIPQQKNPQTDPAILPDKSPRALYTAQKRGYISKILSKSCLFLETNSKIFFSTHGDISFHQ